MVLPCHFHVQKPSVRAYLSVPIVFSRDAEPKAPVRRSRKDLKHPTSTLAITSCTVDTMVHHPTRPSPLPLQLNVFVKYIPPQGGGAESTDPERGRRGPSTKLNRD